MSHLEAVPSKLKLPVATETQAECTAVTSPRTHYYSAGSTEQQQQKRRQGNTQYQAEWTHYQNGEIN